MTQTKKLNWATVFFIAIAAYLGLSLWTLTLSPPVWQDEIQLIDLARSFPQVPRLSTIEGIDYYIPSFFHVLIMQPFLLLFGLSSTALRLPMLLAGLASSLLLRAILVELSIRPSIATLTALLMLTDTIFASSVRGGRPDALAIGLALGAVFLVLKAQSHSRPATLLCLASLCSVASLASWLTSPVILILVPLSLLWTKQGRSSKQTLLKNFLWLTLPASGVLALFVFVGLRSDAPAKLTGLWSVISLNLFAAHSTSDPLTTLVGIYAHFPWTQPWMLLVFLISLVLTIRFPSWSGVTCLISVLLSMIFFTLTSSYAWRFVYLLPAILIMFALGSNSFVIWHERHQLARWAKLYTGIVILIVIGNFVIEPGVRTVDALNHKEALNYSRVEAFFDGRVEPGERVFGYVPPAYYPIVRQDAHFILFFCSDHSDTNRYSLYTTANLEQIDSQRWQLLDGDSASIEFLRTIDLIVTPYEVTAAELLSADGSVRFSEEARLHPEIIYSPRTGEGQAVGYGMVLYRRQ